MGSPAGAGKNGRDISENCWGGTVLASLSHRRIFFVIRLWLRLSFGKSHQEDATVCITTAKNSLKFQGWYKHSQGGMVKMHHKDGR